jgi:hypothetical protein
MTSDADKVDIDINSTQRMYIDAPHTRIPETPCERETDPTIDDASSALQTPPRRFLNHPPRSINQHLLLYVFLLPLQRMGAAPSMIHNLKFILSLPRILWILQTLRTLGPGKIKACWP